MGDILGYDIEGRPLRAGDRAVSVREQITFSVRGAAPSYAPWESETDVPAPSEHPWCLINCNEVRKLTDDDRPATDAFQEWFRHRMDQIHREPNPQYKRKIESRMPWTEGE